MNPLGRREMAATSRPRPTCAERDAPPHRTGDQSPLSPHACLDGASAGLTLPERKPRRRAHPRPPSQAHTPPSSPFPLHAWANSQPTSQHQQKSQHRAKPNPPQPGAALWGFQGLPCHSGGSASNHATWLGRRGLPAVAWQPWADCSHRRRPLPGLCLREKVAVPTGPRLSF